jgi:predicted O-methyltransferase YrrM
MMSWPQAPTTLASDELLERIYRTRQVEDSAGNSYPLHSEVSRDEGELITAVIDRFGFSKGLEIGCAFGLSSLYICGALSRRSLPSHTIIDPGQRDEWHDIGRHHLRQCGYDFFTLIEKPSEIALPSLLDRGERFQFAVIDGRHTFDHVLVDFFFVDRLIDVGGIILLDDLQLPGIRKVARYVAAYPNYQIVGTASQSVFPPSLKRRVADAVLRAVARRLPQSYAETAFDVGLARSDYEIGLTSEMVAFQKTGPDERGSHWYRRF